MKIAECIWKPMSEEPLMSGVVLYSNRCNTLFDGSYIGDGRFCVNRLIVDKSDFTAWCQREDFFKWTGLRKFLNTARHEQH